MKNISEIKVRLQNEYEQIARDVASGKDIDEEIIVKALTGLGKSIDEFEACVSREKNKLELIELNKELNKAEKLMKKAQEVANDYFSKKEQYENKLKAELEAMEKEFWGYKINAQIKENEVKRLQEAITKKEDELRC